MKKKIYDGREVIFIIENIQIDWDWLEEAEKFGKVRFLGSRDSKFKKLTGFLIFFRLRFLILGIQILYFFFSNN